MKLKLTCLAYCILCAAKLQSTAGAGVALTLNGNVIPNHGLVIIDDIGNTDFDSLLCTTDLEVCCDDERLGNWRYPNYQPVRSRKDSSTYHNFFVSRGSSQLRLHRKLKPVREEGLFRCEVPEAASYPNNAVVLVGIYGHNRGFPEIYDISMDRNSLAINCYSKGGPVTEFGWTKDEDIRPLFSGETYTQFKSVFDYSNAKYVVSLQANSESDLIGTFRCSVRNSAGFNERQIILYSDFSSKVVKGCGALATLSNGDLQLSKGFEVGSVVNYICDAGYVVMNKAVVKCLDMGRNGQWTGGRHPHCGKNKDCRSGFSSPNLIVQYTDHYRENSVATFKCEKKYRFVGDPRPRTCRNKNWDGNGPKCEMIQCNSRFDPQHGIVTLLNSSKLSHAVGAVVKYSCYELFVIAGSNTLKCLETGLWDHDTPSCRPSDTVMANQLCGDIKPGAHVSVKYTQRQALFVCNKGYKMKENKVRDCFIGNRSWSHTGLPECKAGAKHLSVMLPPLCTVTLIIITMFLKY